MLRVARAAGVATAAFFSQPCAVDVVYGELWAGRLALPVTDGRELLARGALGVELGPEDVPPFAAAPESQPSFLKMAIGQFDGLEDTDDVLVNSFYELEPEVSSQLDQSLADATKASIVRNKSCTVPLIHSSYFNMKILVAILSGCSNVSKQY